MAPLPAFLPPLRAPPPPAAVIIAPVGAAPIAPIAPATVATPVTVITPTITSPAVANFDDISLRRHRGPFSGHSGSRCDGGKSRTGGNGYGENNVCELHGAASSLMMRRQCPRAAELPLKQPFRQGSSSHSISENRDGAPGRVRTRDPLITNQVLYQLSYKGNSCPTNRFCDPVKENPISADGPAWRQNAGPCKTALSQRPFIL